MTRFDDANSSFQNALESTGTHSPKFLEEALQIHTSKDVTARESQIAADYPNHEYLAMRVHLALLSAANSDVAQADPKLQASIYRDLAVQDLGIAAARMKNLDVAGANKILSGSADDPNSVENFIGKAESLDPTNIDLEQLHSDQDQLMKQISSIHPEMKK